jgi:hypothetical protein
MDIYSTRPCIACVLRALSPCFPPHLTCAEHRLSISSMQPISGAGSSALAFASARTSPAPFTHAYVSIRQHTSAYATHTAYSAHTSPAMHPPHPRAFARSAYLSSTRQRGVVGTWPSLQLKTSGLRTRLQEETNQLGARERESFPSRRYSSILRMSQSPTDGPAAAGMWPTRLPYVQKYTISLSGLTYYSTQGLAGLMYYTKVG